MRATAGSRHKESTTRCNMVDTHPAPIRIRPSTRARVSGSPATTASRRSGPYGLEADRMNAQCRVVPTSGVSGTPAISAAWSSSISSTSG